MSSFVESALSLARKTTLVFRRDPSKRKNAKGDGEKKYVETELECVLCNAGSYYFKSAKLAIMTRDWDFYFCERCNGWFQRSFAHNDKPAISLPIRSERLIRSLNWYHRSEVEALESQLETANWLRKVWRAFVRAYLGVR